ncbi:hypothetical protein CVT26_000625 [Gymnopilus dilepis]|uniref:F-box domain-containing protein n=1 Tax=Gymnopilus dilepis TaxID=231916 RepID=A0A409Y2D8_9AGAR|nr:hypothetical protein CVT26_000625 [Gymnopilus dilepis]
MATILHDDLLYEICKACPVSVLTKFCLASIACYTLAMPNLLHEVVLSRSLESTLRFIRFILDNSTTGAAGTAELSGEGEPRRTQRLTIMDPGNYIHTFRMSWRSTRGTAGASSNCPIAEWAPLLTQAILLMPNLRSVAILANFRQICRYSSQFAEALLSRPHLTSFELDRFGATASRHVGEIVKSKRCEAPRLKYIGFNYRYTFDDWEAAALFKNSGFGSLIYSCRQTLEQLTLADCKMEDLLTNHQPLPGGTTSEAWRPIIYPRVETISCLFEVFPTLDVTVEQFGLSFPSLRTLRLNESIFVRLDHGEDNAQYRKVPFPNLVSISSHFEALSVFLRGVEPPASLQHLDLTLEEFLIDEIGDIEHAMNPTMIEVFRNLCNLNITIEGMNELDVWKDMSILFSSLRYLSLDYQFGHDSRAQELASQFLSFLANDEQAKSFIEHYKRRVAEHDLIGTHSNLVHRTGEFGRRTSDIGRCCRAIVCKKHQVAEVRRYLQEVPYISRGVP